MDEGSLGKSLCRVNAAPALHYGTLGLPYWSLRAPSGCAVKLSTACLQSAILYVTVRKPEGALIRRGHMLLVGQGYLNKGFSYPDKLIVVAIIDKTANKNMKVHIKPRVVFGQGIYVKVGDNHIHFW